MMFIFGITYAEEESTSINDDSAFDFSAEQQKVEELGIPTISSVEILKKEADDLWKKRITKMLQMLMLYMLSK